MITNRNTEECAQSARRNRCQYQLQQFSQAIPLSTSELELIDVFKLATFP